MSSATRRSTLAMDTDDVDDKGELVNFLEQSISYYKFYIWIWIKIMLRMTWKVLFCPKRMCSPAINGEGELWGQPDNLGSPGKMAVKTECV